MVAAERLQYTQVGLEIFGADGGWLLGGAQFGELRLKLLNALFQGGDVGLLGHSDLLSTSPQIRRGVQVGAAQREHIAGALAMLNRQRVLWVDTRELLMSMVY